MDHVVGLLNNVPDPTTQYLKVSGLDPQLEHRLLNTVPPPLELGRQTPPPTVGGDVIGRYHGHRHDAPTHS